MSAIRLYFDVDSMERAVIVALRARGIDVVTSQEVGTTDWNDEGQRLRGVPPGLLAVQAFGKLTIQASKEMTDETARNPACQG